jgi:hypothetical protein
MKTLGALFALAAFSICSAQQAYVVQYHNWVPATHTQDVPNEIKSGTTVLVVSGDSSIAGFVVTVRWVDVAGNPMSWTKTALRPADTSQAVFWFPVGSVLLSSIEAKAFRIASDFAPTVYPPNVFPWMPAALR